jgi:hypothetical protein
MTTQRYILEDFKLAIKYLCKVWVAKVRSSGTEEIQKSSDNG